MNKPTVYYDGEPVFICVDVDGGKMEIAKVYALDHPVSGEGFVRTSKILWRGDDGVFETTNTLYMPKL